LASHPGVRLGYVFGSAARGALRADSDVDVAVRFATRPTLDALAALAINLKRAAGRRADVIDLDTAPPLLLREVVKEGRLLFAASDDERVAFETAALARYADTAHLRHVQAEYLPADAADEYGQIPARLAAHGVLTAATASRLTSLAGFRNVLVHDYAAIDLQRLVEGLARLGDFDAFVADVEGWLGRC